jgi:hypothetical protein
MRRDKARAILVRDAAVIDSAQFNQTARGIVVRIWR